MLTDQACRQSRGSRQQGLAIPTLLATVSILGLSASAALAASAGDDKSSPASVADKTNEELLKKLRAMEKRIEMLEGKLKQKEAAPAAAGQPRPAAAAAGAPA